VRRICPPTLFALAAFLATTATATGATNARLRGTFTMHGRITVAHSVYGEHVGQHVVRTWTFYPQCNSGACSRVVLKRRRSAKHILDTIALNRKSPGVYSGRGRFWIPLECDGQLVRHGGIANEQITVHITRAVGSGGTRYATGITASYYNPSRYQYTRCPGGIGRDGATYGGTLAVKAIAGSSAAGYFILTADGAVFNFGTATSHGGEAGALKFGQHAVGITVQPGGGYWVLNSDGSVKAFGAPWQGSLAGKLHGTRAVGIAASGSAGYLILTSDGGVHPFGNAAWHGSDRGKLARGVRAVSLAVNATGGYWVLTSNGAVGGFGVASQGSLRGRLNGHRPVQIVAAPRRGYLILTGDGGVHPFGKAPFHGSDAGKLPSGVRAVSLAPDLKTGGYWLLKSNGGVDAFHAPWKGSLS
jgi:hypothetical protein